MRCILAAARSAAFAGAALAVCACGGTEPSSLPTSQAVHALRNVHRNSASGKIQHVVIIVQENRSFNNLFYGYPGAKTATYGYDTSGDKIALQPVGLETTWDIEHDSYSFFAACNGMGSYPGTDCQMNGFDNENSECGQSGEPKCPNANPPYSYVPHSETKPYFALAKRYVLADEMFASNFDASSFISHQYIISGQANSTINYPYSYWGCPGGYSDTIYTYALAKRRVVGKLGQFPFDYGFLNGHATLLHAISFQTREDYSLQEAKVLTWAALDTRKVHNDLRIAAIVVPPLEQTAAYDEARRVLASETEVIDANDEALDDFVGGILTAPHVEPIPEDWLVAAA
ncbi:MAG TPA: alkaline phosphatase family protein [Candidatus Cybelea sp.]|jgi:hypothetical protein|nr:alkaline phosphatase family protein [Candidatus Cybelea sp.]